jgi:hypothetical protein
MDQWLEARDEYLDVLLGIEGRPSRAKCSVCAVKVADIKCSDCFGADMFCPPCSLVVHKRSPFHRLLRWTGQHYSPTSLYSLGFIFCLAHDGDPCPKTVEVCSH